MPDHRIIGLGESEYRSVQYRHGGGNPAAVDAIVRWARRGPQHAQVERVEIEPDDGSFTSFEVIG